jgi:hypothetical protein
MRKIINSTYISLVDATSLENGVVILSYRYAETAPDGSPQKD